jgi:3-dehydroquinate synthase class II
VGRVKIEKRPLISLAFKSGDDHGNIIMQADWHVRIMDSAGKPLHITHCKAETKLLGWKSSDARHCGNPIGEQLIER